MQRRGGHVPPERQTNGSSPSTVMASQLTVPKGGDTPVATSSATSGLVHSKRRQRRLLRSSAFSAHFGRNYKDQPLLLVSVCLMGLVVGVLLVLVGFRVANSHGDGGGSSGFGRGLYRPPESIESIGDKSAAYAALRLAYDEEHPDDPVRTRAFVQDLHKDSYTSYSIAADNADEVYDIYNCPDAPPKGYPYQWNILDLLKDWPTDDIRPRPQIYQGFCVFDYMLDLHKATRYREMELPFLVRGDPSVLKAVERWNTHGYVDQLLGDVPHRTEYSANNHFMYWMKPGANIQKKKKLSKPHFTRVEAPEGWTEPTEMMRMVYSEWKKHANTTEYGPDQPHWYYRLIGCGEMGHGDCDKGSSEYLFDELPFFQPKKSLYVVEPEKQKGIHCRFGMKGVIAENHFDGSRNSIALLGGERRYILAHPNQCHKLALYPKGHPSARHSAIDWSDPDLEEFPTFREARANEVIMQAGDVMYLPTNWFHYIVSLQVNFQCNTRSGISQDYMQDIHECGF